MTAAPVRRSITVALAAATLISGCSAGWRQTELAPRALEPRQQVQVWTGPTFVRWHGVIVSPDSVSGVPYFQASACDTCRHSVPRAAVDSLLVGNPVGAFWKTVGLVLAALLGVCYAVCPREMS